ncbi:hypothetical protein H4219_000414 [Mycoemilia scoparia]|uniref:Exonuclease 1 n=1 Tax=Mycoemilia scoparia TaxID=417184 RepID=A0A9W8A2Y0_9FUNG|nr:hypothetical protein H4219_000414 [Mycoemilia scoparia]
MGITGLLPLLREAQVQSHIRELAGHTVGIDTYVWLYKGSFSCATELALGNPTRLYIDYVMRKVHLLRNANVTPYLVFDGGNLPSKQVTEDERAVRKKRNFEEGMRLWNGPNRKPAFEYFQRALEVTPDMAKAVIEELKREGVQYIVAPYEADAQLAYLEKKGIISAIITEDSDVIPYGVKRVFFKMDQYGNGTLFDRDLLYRVKCISLAGWTDEMIRHLCILSGCDYLNSIQGIGLKRAHKFLSAGKTVEAAIQKIKIGGYSVPPDYYKEFKRADLTFLHQRVYDPVLKKLTTVTPLPGGPEAKTWDFIGAYMDDETADAIARGEINPIDHKPLKTQILPPQLSLRPGMIYSPTPQHKVLSLRMPSKQKLGGEENGLKRSSQVYDSQDSTYIGSSIENTQETVIEKVEKETSFYKSQLSNKRTKSTELYAAISTETSSKYFWSQPNSQTTCHSGLDDGESPEGDQNCKENITPSNSRQREDLFGKAAFLRSSNPFRNFSNGVTQKSANKPGNTKKEDFYRCISVKDPEKCPDYFEISDLGSENKESVPIYI